MKKNPKEKDAAPKHALSSRQWRSESTRTQPSSSEVRPKDSPSGVPPSDCKKCHIDFLEQEVTVPWSAGGTYNANSNMDTSKGGWEPDYWTPFTLPLGTKVLKDGTVIFGKEGGYVTLRCKVKRCPKCTGSFKLNFVRLAIFYKGVDVTDKSIPPTGEKSIPGRRSR